MATTYCFNVSYRPILAWPVPVHLFRPEDVAMIFSKVLGHKSSPEMKCRSSPAASREAGLILVAASLAVALQPAQASGRLTVATSGGWELAHAKCARNMAVGRNPVPLVNIIIDGTWVLIRPKIEHGSYKHTFFHDSVVGKAKVSCFQLSGSK